MNKLRICILFTVLSFTVASNSSGQHTGTSGYTLNDVHTWPDSKCIICHVTDKPDGESHALIDNDISRLCASCHKGKVTILPNARLQSSIEGMHNHPIKFSLLDFASKKINQNIIKDGKYYYISGKEGKLPLYGESRSSLVAECATCHDPHGKAKKPKLHYIDNGQSQVCVICHIDKVL